MSLDSRSLLLRTGMWAFNSASGGCCGFQNLRNLSAFLDYSQTFRCPPYLVACFVQFVNLFAGSAMFFLLGLSVCGLLNVVARRPFLFLNAKSAIVFAIPLMLDRQLIDACTPGFRSACRILQVQGSMVGVGEVLFRRYGSFSASSMAADLSATSWGFIASWLINFLLTKGYIVRGAVRTNPAELLKRIDTSVDDALKYEHLRELEGANERLELVKADILDYQSLLTVIRGCHGVFHMAAVLNNDPEKVIEPATEGTRNVMEACAETGVKRVVFTSSIGAVYMDPHRESLAIVNDDCWSDLDYCIQTNNWYCYAKTLAEKSAWEIAERRNIELVVINPGLVLGPLLQSAMNPSTSHIMKYLTGSAKTYANLTQLYVDVRDVAQAHILVYETASASGQRYLCAECNLHRADLVHMLARQCPRCSHTTRCSDEKNPRKQPYMFSNQKLKDLGLSFTPMNQCLADTVASLHNRGFLEH